MTTAAPVLIQLEMHRLAARAAAGEAKAKAEGRWLEFALEMQALSCASVADAIFVRFSDRLAALRRDAPALSAEFQGTVADALEELKRNARAAAASSGMTQAEGEHLALAGAAGFTARMALLFFHASEGGCA